MRKKFTTYLDEKQIEWLRKKALKTGKTAAEVLRELIDKERNNKKKG